MAFRALATDYDGTIASQGVVDEPTLAALNRLRGSGRKLILVTGREIEDLAKTFHRFELFDIIVAENGAVLFWPEDHKEQVLAKPPSAELVKSLVEKGVSPLSVGCSIIATFEPHETTVLEAIKELGLELHVIFNKGAVMVLPTGVNKATGLKAALPLLGLAPDEVVGVGDAENDHAFLELCGCQVAVQNALSALKKHACYVTPSTHGAGVAELIDRWLTSGLDDLVGGNGKQEEAT